jgi:hypothetical protein
VLAGVRATQDDHPSGEAPKGFSRRRRLSRVRWGAGDPGKRAIRASEALHPHGVELQPLLLDCVKCRVEEVAQRLTSAILGR